MSVYYVHNKQAVLDLINRKTTQLPIVAFRNRQDAAKYEGLELLYRTVSIGIVKMNYQEPLFVVADTAALHGSIDPHDPAISQKVCLFPELVGQIPLPTQQSGTGGVFVNETLDLKQVLDHLFDLFKQTLLDVKNLDIEFLQLLMRNEGDISTNGGIAMCRLNISDEDFARTIQPVLIKHDGYSLLTIVPQK